MQFPFQNMSNMSICEFEEGSQVLPGSDTEANPSEQIDVPPKGDVNTPRSAKQNIYNCADCPYKSSYKSNLVRHIRTAHKTDDSFVCTDCGRAFASKELLDQHKTEHQKDFFCEICGKKYGSKKGIRVHKKNATKV